MVDADTDPPRIDREVVDPVWHRATQFLDQEVMDPDFFRVSLGAIFAPVVAEIPRLAVFGAASVGVLSRERGSPSG
jgi:hypothetical protein